MKFRFFPIFGIFLLLASVYMIFALWKNQQDQGIQRERMTLLQDAMKKIKTLPVDEISQRDLQPFFESFQTGTPNPGMAIGIVFGARTFPHYFGTATAQGAPVNDETIFEIASVTKTYTTLLLAKAVQEKRVTLDQSAESLLGITLPKLKGKPITLQDLATHASGLPRLPSDFTLREQITPNPYQAYSLDRLLRAVSASKLEASAGNYAYSNFGMALLGQALAKAYQKPYEVALREEILIPLGLRHTWIQVPSEAQKNRAEAFSKGKPTSAWDLNAFEPAGGIRSTLPDLLSYLQFMGYPDRTPFPEAIREVQKPRLKVTSSMDIALAWHISTYREGKIVWHNGESGGFHAFVGYWKDLPMGVTILTNSTDDFADVIGIRLLQAMKQM